MKREPKIRVTANGVREFFDRAREHARKLDRGEELAPEVTVLFENASDMIRVLSAERIRLLRKAREKAIPVSDLAADLKRDIRAVGRDVDLLERLVYYAPGSRRILDTEDDELSNLVAQNTGLKPLFSSMRSRP